VRSLLLLMLTAAMGFTQARDPAPPRRPAQKKAAATAPDKWPIERLAVEGNRGYTREQVLAVAGLKVGQLAGKPEFDAARDRLVASGAFETVSYRFVPDPNGQGYAATFQITEANPMLPVRFEELGVPDGEIEAALHARDPLFSTAHLPATQAVLDRYVAWIQQFLAGKAITETIAGRVTATAPDQFAIVFRPARNLPAVALVTFEGNQVIPQGPLREAVSGVAVGMLYTEGEFRSVLNTSVVPLYERRGRIRVAFPKIRTEPAGDVQGINVFVAVDEGQSYDLGNVEIAGPAPVSPTELLKAGDFKTGDLANFDRVNEGLDRIRKAVRRAGYMDARVSSSRRIDDQKKTVDVTVSVDAGSQFAMGKLNIVGLDLDSEAEMRRIWTMSLGKPFNPDYPDFFLSKVREAGLFDNLGSTEAEIQVNSQARTADVTLRFTGAGEEQRLSRRKQP